MTPQQYDIYFADLDPTIGSEMKKIRPVVVISQDAMNQHLETIVICPMTSSLHPSWRSRVQVQYNNKESEIAVDQIRTISKQRLKRKIGRLNAEESAQLRRYITEMYGE